MHWCGLHDSRNDGLDRARLRGSTRSKTTNHEPRFDLLLSFVPGPRDQIFQILLGEMGREEAHSGKMKPTALQLAEEDRKPSSGASDMDPTVGGILGHVQLLDAVGEHGWIFCLGIEASIIHLGDVSKKVRRGRTVPSYELGQPAKKDTVAQVIQCVLAHRNSS